MDSVKSRIEKLVADGIFGDGKLLEISDTSGAKGEQFASQLFFLQLYLETNSPTRFLKIPVVAKIQAGSEERELMGTDVQFANEVFMYDQVLPALDASGLACWPKMLYGHATNGRNPKEDLIILDDLRPQGFAIAESLLLDSDHVTVAMRKLGEFHGMSYQMKKNDPKRFQALTESLLPRKNVESKGLFEGFARRGFQPLVENSPRYTIPYRAYIKLTRDTFVEFIEKMLRPAEPFSVILHGDFNRGNVLFCYDQDRVSDVKFFDFALSAYADPAIDLSFFLYMNTSAETRAAHWDAFLKIYWDGVTSVASDLDFSFEDFLTNFAQRAIYGYYIASFYLPMLMFPEMLLMPKTVLEMGLEEKIEWSTVRGGEKVTKLTASIAFHLLEKGYLEAFVFHFPH